MTIYKCDKCNAEFEDDSKLNLLNLTNVNDYNQDFTEGITQKEICSKCMQKVISLLKKDAVCREG